MEQLTNRGWQRGDEIQNVCTQILFIVMDYIDAKLTRTRADT